MKHRLLWLALVWSLWVGSAGAVSDPREMLHNRALEARAEAIGGQLRCLVCQNESLEASDADLARDLRRAVREQIVSGATNRQIMDWMVARYGNFVRLRPPFDGETALLWSAPVLALTIAFTIVAASRRRRILPTVPLTEEERSRLETVLSASAEQQTVSRRAVGVR